MVYYTETIGLFLAVSQYSCMDVADHCVSYADASGGILVLFNGVRACCSIFRATPKQRRAIHWKPGSAR